MYDHKGRPQAIVNAVDHLLKLTKSKGLWDTVEFILNIWFENHKEKYEEHKQLMEDVRETRKKDEAITEKTRMKYMGEIPQEVMETLEMVIGGQIQQYGERKFYREFFSKYPYFRSSRKRYDST